MIYFQSTLHIIYQSQSDNLEFAYPDLERAREE